MRTIITALASLLLAPFAASVAVEIVKPWLPPGLRILEWMTAMYEAAAFPWVVAGAGGLLIGLWLDKVSARFDGRHPMTKAGKAKALALDVSILGLEIESALSPMWGTPSVGPTDYIRAITMFRRLSALGLPTPQGAQKGQKPEDVLRAYATYLRQVAVPLKAGDMSLAKAVAQGLTH